MKFENQLLSKSNHIWEDQYINYEKLKSLVRKKIPAAPDSSSSDDTIKSTLPPETTPPTSTEDNNYDGSKKDGLMPPPPQPPSVDLDRWLNAPESISDTTKTSQQQQQQEKEIEVADEALIALIKRTILSELEKINSFFISQELEAKRRSKQLEEEWDEGLQGLRKDDWIKRVYQFCNFLEDLQSYVSLNQMGFRKILKKYDKYLNTTLTEDLGPIINEAYFSKSPVPRQLLLKAKRRLTASMPRSPKTRLSISGSLLTPQIPTFASLNLDALPAGLSRMWICLATDGLSQPISVPVMIAKGEYTGPVVGITAALHGNELNGIPLIHRLFREFDSSQLSGAVVAVIVANTPGYLRAQRGFSDGTDLNRMFPGKEMGTAAQVYVHSLMENIINRCHYVLDLHTASLGRANSLYVRTDMNNETTRRMARLQNPQIIVHNTGYDQSLRGAAVDRGIPAITVEIGNPQRFQERFIKFALIGVENILCSLEMVPREPEHPEYEPIVCSRSFWIFTTSGGILEVLPDVNTLVREGELIARVHTIFGDEKEFYHAPIDGIVIGKSINPVCQTGDRILHLGVFGDVFQRVSEDGHL